MLDNIKEKILDNGLKVICLKKSDTPIVSVQVWYRTGSAWERDGIRGISHFLEHMMFRGSTNLKSEEHAMKINNVGGHCNAFTAEDVTAYLNSVPQEYLDMVLGLEAERMSGLSIQRELFDIERKVIIEEFHNYLNNPVARAFLEFRQEFFKNHPYSISPLGTLDDLNSITNEDCRNYYQSHYRPDNAVIVVVGDFSNDSDLFERVEKHFGSKKAAIINPKKDEEQDVNEWFPAKQRMKRRVDFNVPIFITGFPAPASAHNDALSLEILQLVLSGGETGRLHREMVRKDSVAVMVGGMNHTLRRAGMSVFFAAFTPNISVSKVEKSLNRQIEKIKNGGISKEEFEKVKNTTLSSRTFELYSADHIAQRIGFSETIEGSYGRWVERLEALKSLDIDSLVEVAQKYWDQSKSSTLHLKPKRVNPMLYVAGLFRRFTRKKG
ncbi:pitrilysin family protein [Chitinispirillales bacterium ANBcel5]|uniref:M16 family metallopeptidase n=1 Tax=Cellulosispirillum alkaliphilum TaxID=3039283 RepID=UPI002A4FC2AB|nr:pitrilysin family protein [Chitinispirillales bacterium ANBcel5]